MIATAGAPAAAEVLDAVYRGTLVCDKLPFTDTKMREAIECTISGGVARYTHIVRLRDTAGGRGGTGQWHSQWPGHQPARFLERREPPIQGELQRRLREAQRQAHGAQTWTDGGRTVTRACSGAIKRPLKAFLRRDNKKPAKP